MIAKSFIGFEISLPMAVGVTLNRQLSRRRLNLTRAVSSPLLPLGKNGLHTLLPSPPAASHDDADPTLASHG
jgi:hypothetical protein